MCLCVPCLSFPLHTAAVCTVQPAWARHHLCSPGWEYIEFQALGGKLSIQPWEGSGPCRTLLQQECEGKLLPQSGFIFFIPWKRCRRKRGIIEVERCH